MKETTSIFSRATQMTTALLQNQEASWKEPAGLCCATDSIQSRGLVQNYTFAYLIPVIITAALIPESFSNISNNKTSLIKGVLAF